MDNLRIIREVFVSSHTTCVIRANTYDSRLCHFLMLLEEARKDFPDLKPENVEVKYYAGQSYKRTFGIEFRVEGDVPDSYSSINQLETTL